MPLFRLEAGWEGEARHSTHEPGDLPAERKLTTPFEEKDAARRRNCLSGEAIRPDAPDLSIRCASLPFRQGPGGFLFRFRTYILRM